MKNIMENVEIWKPIEGFKNYEVSSFGRVRNVKFNRVIHPHLRNGYERIGISDGNGNQKKFAVNRLVAKAFLQSFNEDLEVDHIDRVRTNNYVTNLRCVNRKENLNNLTKSKIFKMTNFIETLAKENSLVTVDDLVNHFKNNNTDLNKFMRRF
jgi:hypothetical protein